MVAGGSAPLAADGPTVAEAGREPADHDDAEAGAALHPFLEAKRTRTPLEGRVIGWNDGGFHVLAAGQAAFCPRSQMEIGSLQGPQVYLERTFAFHVLRVQRRPLRVIVSRATVLRAERTAAARDRRKALKAGAVVEGTVASLADFGAFVDLGADVRGLVHVSEIAREAPAHPSERLTVGQQVAVKILRVEKGGRRISLSLRALELDPWADLASRLAAGTVVRGRVERSDRRGAVVALEAGVSGWLAASQMGLPRETSPARVFPPGKELSVQVLAVDLKKKQIALSLEGAALEGSRADYQEYLRRQKRDVGGKGFNALAAAFRRAR